MDKGDHTGLTDFAFWVLLACILSFVFPCFPDCENPLVLVFSFPPQHSSGLYSCISLPGTARQGINFICSFGKTSWRRSSTAMMRHCCNWRSLPCRLSLAITPRRLGWKPGSHGGVIGEAVMGKGGTIRNMETETLRSVFSVYH